jgi:hypothetical protein
MDNLLEATENIELDYMLQFYAVDDTKDERDEARQDRSFALYG